MLGITAAGSGPPRRSSRRLASVQAAALLVLSLFACAPAWADQNDPRLAPLFDQLKGASDATAAQALELEIWRVWGEAPDSGSQALLDRGEEAIGRGDLPAARGAFDLLVRRAPGFAEAWNKRATASYLAGDDAASIADIRRTLELEPRHFGALSGLGLILTREGRLAEAVRSFEAALAINPFLRGGHANVERLRKQLEGQPI